MGSMSWVHWVVLIAVVMILFGKGRLSDIMGDAAKGIKSFKKGLADDDDDVAATRPAPRLQGQPPLEPNADRELQPMKDDRPHG